VRRVEENAHTYFEEQYDVVGRLANYKYYNMDAAILAALEVADMFEDCK